LKVRFEERIVVNLEVEPGLDEVQIPPSTLQPLVENCIQHGFKDRVEQGNIQIDVHRNADHVTFRICDDGVGIDPKQLHVLGKLPLSDRQVDSQGNGLGVHNVNRRLIQLCGESAALHFSNCEQGGACVAFQIPLTLATGGDRT
jgi:two-component system, LytTR family, sensor histidine kinase LytS